MKYNEYAEMAQEAIRIRDYQFAQQIIDEARTKYESDKKEHIQMMKDYEDSDRSSFGIAYGFLLSSESFDKIIEVEKRLKLGKLEEVLLNTPEVAAEKGIIQNEFHQYDVYDHTIAVVKALKEKTNDPNMIAAAYLHDIGKPITAKPREYEGVLQKDENGNIRHTFPDHEFVGEEMVRKMNPNLFIEYNLDQDKVARIVGIHYEPMKGIHAMRKTRTYTDFEKAYHQLERTLDQSGLTMEEVMNIFLADSIGKGNAPVDQPELLLVRDVLLMKRNLSLREVYKVQKNTIRRGYAEKE